MCLWSIIFQKYNFYKPVSYACTDDVRVMCVGCVSHAYDVYVAVNVMCVYLMCVV